MNVNSLNCFVKSHPIRKIKAPTIIDIVIKKITPNIKSAISEKVLELKVFTVDPTIAIAKKPTQNVLSLLRVWLFMNFKIDKY